MATYIQLPAQNYLYIGSMRWGIGAGIIDILSRLFYYTMLYFYFLCLPSTTMHYLPSNAITLQQAVNLHKLQLLIILTTIILFPRTVAWYWWHTLDSNKNWNSIASLTTHSSPLMKYRVLLILTYRFGHQDKNWAVSVYLHWRPGTMVCASEDGQWPSTTQLSHR